MALAGYGGSITCSNVTVGVRGWTLDWSVDDLDTTDFGDSGESTGIRGIRRATATFDVVWNVANTLQPGDTIASLILNISATSFYTAAGGFLQSMTINDVVDGLATATYTARISGGVTPTLA